MRNGQHQLLARHQQVFGTATGYLQFSFITVTARHVAPYQHQEESCQQYSPHSHSGNGTRRTLTNLLLIFGLSTGTLKRFFLVILQQAVDSCRKHMVHPPQVVVTPPYDNAVGTFFLGNLA
ncbi:unknown [Bacteroides sp. CAG:633]|nr:unknown [Bacteroides sp. CAG:633]